MISEALVIGALDAAIYRDLSGLKAIRLEEGKVVDCSRDLSLLLSSGAEKRYLQPVPVSLEQLIEQLQFWSERHYLLKLLIRGMDSVCRDKTRVSCMQIAERLSQQSQLAEFAQARLLGCALPESADLAHALVLSTPYPAVHALYQQLAQVKSLIPTVVRQLQNLLYFDFAGDHDASLLLRLAVDNGLIKTAVMAVYQQDKHQLDLLVMNYSTDNDLKKLIPRLPHLLNAWRNQLNDSFPFKSAKTLQNFKEPEFQKPREETTDSIELVAEILTSWQKRTERKKTRIKQTKLNQLTQKLRIEGIEPIHKKQALDAVKRQKEFIFKLIRQGRISQLEQEVVDLVRHQKQANAKLSDVCKTLSDVGSRLIESSYGELAIKIYSYAQQANSKDVVAYNGYAETLRSLGRHEEALQAYQDTKQQFPNNVVPCAGYAETLRSLGQHKKALQAYQDTKQQFPNDVVACSGYAQQANSKDVVAYNGYAETLRSLERHEDALQAYQDTIKQFPTNRVAKNAFACLLIELEDYTQARELLNSETPQSLDGWRDYHVLAMSYLHEGNMQQAEEMLRYGVAHAPFISQQYFKNALGFLYIKQNQAAKALEHLQLSDNSIILFPQQALLYSHALAETDDKARAQAVLAQVPQKTAEIIDFCAVLKQRYLTAELINAVVKEDLDRKIYRYELNSLLRIAA